MPIRINLLAEAQAEEEARRKDPVKRAILVAVLLVVCVLFWSAMLQTRIFVAKSNLGSLEAKWKSLEAAYKHAVACRQQVLDTEEKLAALAAYSTNRFLWGSALNALQQTFNGVENIRLVRLKTEQTYVISEATKPVQKGNQTIPGKPATSTERIQMLIDAIDWSPQPGGANVSDFKEAIASVPFFKTRLDPTNGVLLISRSAPQTGPLAPTPYVMFTLQCTFPEIVRQ